MNAVLRAQKAQPGTVREKTKRLGALQRALDTPAPSAALVFGDVLAHLARLRARGPGEAGVQVLWRVDRNCEVWIESGVAIFDADSLCAYCAAKGFAAQLPATAGMQRPAAGVGFDAVFRISDAPLVVCGELCFRFDLAAGGLLGHINPTSEDPTRILTRILKSRSPRLSAGAVSIVACPLKRSLLARAEQEGWGLGALGLLEACWGAAAVGAGRCCLRHFRRTGAPYSLLYARMAERICVCKLGDFAGGPVLLVGARGGDAA